MNYDITMCDDGLCSKREQCHRFIAYQKYKGDKSKNKPTMVSMIAPRAKANGACSLYWENKK